MIDIKSLTKDDVGKWVSYSGNFDEVEYGKIKSWNESFVFVVYKCNHDWDNFENYTVAATAPKSLYFLNKEYIARRSDQMKSALKKFIKMNNKWIKLMDKIGGGDKD